jgi:hypothetical protein
VERIQMAVVGVLRKLVFQAWFEAVFGHVS